MPGHKIHRLISVADSANEGSKVRAEETPLSGSVFNELSAFPIKFPRKAARTLKLAFNVSGQPTILIYYSSIPAWREHTLITPSLRFSFTGICTSTVKTGKNAFVRLEMVSFIMMYSLMKTLE